MKLRTRASVVAAALLLSATARAGIVEYDLTNISGSTWRYDYTVTNDAVAMGVWEFTIWFGQGLYDALAVASTPAGWDSILAQPEPALPADGFFDSLTFTNRIALGASASGFGVTFDWLGTGTPGPQLYEFLDPESLRILDGGLTRGRPNNPDPEPNPNPNPVPEPSVLALFAAGLMTATFAARRRRFPAAK